MKIENFKGHLSDDWLNKLKKTLESKEIDDIFQYLRKRKDKVSIYPSSDNMFRAFRECTLKDIKIVILGQDPFYTPNVANGLAFSTDIEFYIPPSLENIYQEITSDIYNNVNTIGRSGDLGYWASQGVFLFNTALTVEIAMPGAHTQLWKPFTKEVLKVLNDKEPIVFMLWGNHAQSYESLITNKEHLILKAVHPSPLSAYKGFFGCKHFSKANEFLEKIYGKSETISW